MRLWALGLVTLTAVVGQNIDSCTTAYKLSCPLYYYFVGTSTNARLTLANKGGVLSFMSAPARPALASSFGSRPTVLMPPSHPFAQACQRA